MNDTKKMDTIGRLEKAESEYKTARNMYLMAGNASAAAAMMDAKKALRDAKKEIITLAEHDRKEKAIKAQEADAKKQDAKTERGAKEDLFRDIMRGLEAAYTTDEYGEQLQTLARIVAFSVLSTVIDPRKKSVEKDMINGKLTGGMTASGGCNPLFLRMRRQLMADITNVSGIIRNGDMAYRITFNKRGHMVRETVDVDAKINYDNYAQNTISDGYDIVQNAAESFMLMAKKYSFNGNGWLEMTFKADVMKRQVLTRIDKQPEYKTVDIIPIQQIFRAARKGIDGNRAVRIDPTSAYSYADYRGEDDSAEDIDTIYFRFGKCADIGGEIMDGLYTIDYQSIYDVDTIIRKMGLSDRQETVLTLRLRNFSKEEIATYIGSNEGNVGRIFRQIRVKAEKIGFSPSLWYDMGGALIDDTDF